MNILNTIDITSVIFFALLAWAVIATVVLLDKMEELEIEKAKRKEDETADQEVAVTPTEIPKNDKDWHIRTDIVEGMRASIIRSLENYPALLVDTESVDGHEFALTHGEVCALIAPFLQKGYFAYQDTMGYGADRVTRFKISKHRFTGSNALEITEELLTKNAQL
ncbi:hypothetical protein [Porphyromonas sp. oral taxon 278]|uniref:hypothetical protein n=1 Tax=Porphyromonas sp. oral taxon 278 TaxID=712437 RepID=UPI0025D305DA|nr:hypothetical protein [Porphyromonas sp. oral taxon 278]